jgi:hypothetical protein
MHVYRGEVAEVRRGEVKVFQVVRKSAKARAQGGPLMHCQSTDNEWKGLADLRFSPTPSIRPETSRLPVLVITLTHHV